ncbi:MAG: HAD family hydrolase [Hyphomonadaceae bacterium]|nr:MAG: HAD family hydrolase [Hyphomonadaceae bacterium]
MKTQIITKLSQISDNYDAIFCDVWGVIHDGYKQYRPAVLALQEFRKRGKPVVLISNAPRPSKLIPLQLNRLEIEPSTYDEIVTSGDACINIINNMGRKAYKLGPEKDLGLYDALDVDFVNIDEAQFIVCSGPRDDLNDKVEDYRDELREMAKTGIPFVCANPDRVVQMGDRLIPCAGALADIYEEYGGEVIMPGKPNAPIYELTEQKAEAILSRKLERSRILCIGDGIQTDIQGAQNQGLDCLFVAGGIHAEELWGIDGLDEAKTEAFLAQNKLYAKYAIAELE